MRPARDRRPKHRRRWPPESQRQRPQAVTIPRLGTMDVSERRRKQRYRKEVLFDAADATNAFSSDAKRIAFFGGLIIGEPKVHDAVTDDYVLRPNRIRPFFTAECAKKMRADRAIIAFFRACWSTL